ncbi:S1 family serine peptidase [Bradyrhizobium liaoningense]|uniref:S1 family serine peptidase n=1 Tax=Bradyrhizobium liaoningense TaxID=43992 RepID=UPI0009DAA6FB|nr:serine protease [Bradyrhizobium liaoningense]
MKTHTAVALGLTFALLQAVPASAQQPRADLARTEPRILYGTAVLAGQGAWAASLRAPTLADPKTLAHVCGGSFVDPRYDATKRRVVSWSASQPRPQWLLTAAHCVVENGMKMKEADLRVVGGTLDLTSAQNGDEQEVEQIFVHPDFNADTMHNDVALLRLRPPTKDLDDTRRISIRLPTNADSHWIGKPYLALRVQGWGRTESGFQSARLLEVLIPQVDRQACRAAFEAAGEKLSEGTICAGFTSGDFDSCQGDSGGPLIYRSQSPSPSPGMGAEPTLIGVVSWGIGCGSANLYGVYTSTMAYRRWAETQVVAYYNKK